MTRTKEELLTENEELLSRLDEMEEAIRAIRSGEVDAIVVSGDNGEQVYSVSSAETPYRTFIEKMSEGAVTLTKDGTILFCNQRFSELVQSPYERVIGTSLKRFIAPDEITKIDSFLTQVAPDNHDVIIVTLKNTIYLRLSMYHLPPHLHGDNYLLLIATDISDLKKKEAELNDIIVRLVTHLHKLRDLRIDNINETIDAEGRKNQLELANKKLSKEILKLNSLILKLKEKQKNYK